MIAVLCTIGGLVARLHGLGSKPFWLDEVTTLHRSALPFWAMVRDSLSFHHLPSYFVISSWFLGFGHDETALRLPAALFGALSCGLASLIAGELAGLGAGLLAGTLMAVSPIEVQYGQEARSYTLVICCVLLALHGLIGLLRDPARAAAGWQSDGGASIGRWSSYIAGTLGGLLVLGVALWWLLIANLTIAVAALGAARLPAAFVRRWIAVQAAIGLLAAPGFVAMVFLVERAHGTFQSGLDWIPPLSWHHVGTALASLYMLRVSSLIADRLFAPSVPGLGVLILALAGAGILALRRSSPRASLALVVGTVALPAATALVSLVEPLFMPRYVLWSTGPFLILVGAGLGVLPSRTRLPASVLVGAAAVVNLIPYYHTETKPRWEMAAHVLSARLRPGDMLLISDPASVEMMNVFLARAHEAIPPELWTENMADASCALYSGRRVWAVFGRVGQVDHEDLGQFLEAVAPLGPPASRISIGLDISLALYDHPAGPCVAQG